MKTQRLKVQAWRAQDNLVFRPATGRICLTLNRVRRSVTEVNYTPLIIGIAGGTGSGKTTAAREIVNNLPSEDAALVQHDWYYRDVRDMSIEERAHINFDEPNALENQLLVAHLERLKAGYTVECPQYDFTTHLRSEQTITVPPRRIIVVEGILLFAIPELRDRFDLRLFIDTDDDIRLMRRIKRDILERGRTIESIQRQYYETVRPMHKKYVEPSREVAHLIVPEGGENRQAVEVIVGRLMYFLSLGKDKDKNNE